MPLQPPSASFGVSTPAVGKELESVGADGEPRVGAATGAVRGTRDLARKSREVVLDGCQGVEDPVGLVIVGLPAGLLGRHEVEVVADILGQRIEDVGLVHGVSSVHRVVEQAVPSIA